MDRARRSFEISRRALRHGAVDLHRQYAGTAKHAPAPGALGRGTNRAGHRLSGDHLECRTPLGIDRFPGRARAGPGLPEDLATVRQCGRTNLVDAAMGIRAHGHRVLSRIAYRLSLIHISEPTRRTPIS